MRTLVVLAALTMGCTITGNWWPPGVGFSFDGDIECGSATRCSCRTIEALDIDTEAIDRARKKQFGPSTSWR